jgi:two-component system response regulator AtoC
VSAAWRKLLLQAELIAPHLHLATIEGESGVGKQTFARILHSHSGFSGSSFRRFDARDRLADFEPAIFTGFLYVDRVELFPQDGQRRLLTALKTLQDRPGAFCIIASSEIPLHQFAAQGSFLPELAFRLSAVRFPIPPLRQRKDDIPPLVDALLKDICARYQIHPVSLAPEALTRLLQHSWPGNIRELASVLESSVFASANGVIRAEDLQLPAESDPASSIQPPRIASFALDAVIRHHVRYVLDLNRGNKLRTAHQLGISRSTLYRILDPPAKLP